MKEFLQYNINRYDHFYDSVNNKGQFLLGINTFLLSGYITIYVVMSQKKIDDWWLCALIFILFTTSVLSVLLTLLAITPYTKSGGSSLMYYGSVGVMKEPDFKKKIESLTDESIEDDLIRQQYIMAKGLRRKFRLMKASTILLCADFALIVPTFILLFNHKNTLLS